MNMTEQGILSQFPYWKKATFPSPLRDMDSLHVVIGCGTSYNLALTIAAAMTESGMLAMAVPAGEWYLRPHSYVSSDRISRTVVIALSRSGSTTETVDAARASRDLGQTVIGLTCAPDTPLAKVCTTIHAFETFPDEGIVMTASASLMLLAGLALAGFDIGADLADRAQAMLETFDKVSPATYSDRTHFVFLGGGANYGLALEGALKLQEMALCFTQGFHPGEYRHGPVSLVDEKTAIVMLYHPETRDLEEALTRELSEKGALIIGFDGLGDVSVTDDIADPRQTAVILPSLQLLGERYAAVNGVDTTQPRHLTKVVVLDK